MQIALILSVLVMVVGCGNDEPQPTSGRVADPAGQEYQWKRMDDGKNWLVENLNYATHGDNTYWYNNNEALGETYGRLYDWGTAKLACSLLGEGWKLPTDEQWKNLVSAYGQWDDIGISTEGYTALVVGGRSGFSAKLGGWGSLDFQDFYALEEFGAYWSASDGDNDLNGTAYRFHKEGSYLIRVYVAKQALISCRCVQD